MKKQILIFGLLATFSTQAQVREENDVEFSPFFGYTRSGFYGGQSIRDYKSIGNVNFGINVDFYTNERWSIRTGIEYLPLGASIFGTIRIADPGGDYFETKKLVNKLEFISIPIHANYHFGSKRNWNLDFGPTISYLLSSKFDGKKVSTKGLNHLQLGVAVGLGYKIIIDESFSLGIEYKEYIGIINNVKASKYSSERNYIFNYSGALNLKAIYKFGAKKDE